MTTESKLLIAAVIADLLWVASITYVVHDASRRRVPRLPWALITLVTGPAGLVYWLLTRGRRTPNPTDRGGSRA